jgi:hypothetical protein
MSGRSATATYHGADYESVLTGKAVDSIWDAPTWQLMSLCAIALIVLFEPTVLHKTRSRSLSFWVAILAVAAATPETTSIPILSTIISTRTAYPYIIVIPHSFIAAATYRSKHGDNVHYLESFSLAFFLYGFGGSILSDLLMGLHVTALSHVRIIPCYIIGWSLVWLSPFDFLYQKYINSSSALHYFLQACEAIDSVTTPMGRISRSAHCSWIVGGFRRDKCTSYCRRINVDRSTGDWILEDSVVFFVMVGVGRSQLSKRNLRPIRGEYCK